MPRQAHGRSLAPKSSAKPLKRKNTSSQFLNALEVAERQNPSRNKVRRHRLGEIEDDDDRAPEYATNFDQRSSKRRKISADGRESDDDVMGSDGDGNQWHVGVDDEDEDSEIDSDEAMGDSDKETLDGVASAVSASTLNKTARRLRATTSRKTKSRDVDLAEDASDESERNEDMDDNLGEEAIDLATALDMNDEKERLETRASRPAISTLNADGEGFSEKTASDLDSGEDHDSDEAESDSQSQLSFSDEDDGTSHLNLGDFVESLDPKTVSHGEDDHVSPKTTKLSYADILPFVQDPGLRKSVKMLYRSEKAEPKGYSGGVPGRLQPPLAKRQQDRLDRAAAYDKSKETLSRWIDTVKQNRRAEHISFPLAEQNVLAASAGNQLLPTSQSAPLTDLESAIQSIMEESGLDMKAGQTPDEQEQAFEELQEKKMPFEEVQARRAELRQVRELMFREEIRARRIKKIKSKAFRRVHRRERDKAGLEERARMVAEGVLNSDDEREQNDRRRAEERMGARHRESKWAKGVKSTGRAAWDEDARNGVTDLARRDEELRKRIEGKQIADSDQSDLASESADSDESDWDGDDGDHRLRSQLDALTASSASGSDMTKLGSMAFMQKAEASRKAANDAELKAIRRSMNGNGDYSSNEDSGVETTGRLKFGGRQVDNAPKEASRVLRDGFEERLSEDELDSDIDIIASAGRNDRRTDEARTTRRETDTSRRNGVMEPQANPWTGQTSKQPKRTRPPNDESESIIQNTYLAHVTAESSAVLAGQKPRSPRHSGPPQSVPLAADLTSSSGSDEEDDLDDSGGATTITREQMVEMAFAGDNTLAEFAKEKRETVEEEGDQVMDNTLPGWGSWTGAGISKREQKRGQRRFLTTIKGVPEKARKDSKLDRVIINEKRVKKNAKYLASELPHPFESRQQYERSLRLPIGPEWATKSSFQDATKPRLLIKQGVIRAMGRPMV